jgi:hypothetical protein
MDQPAITRVRHGAPLGRRPSTEWVLQFDDGKYFLADDEPPVEDVVRAHHYVGRKLAQHEAGLVSSMWNEPVRMVKVK